MGGAAALPIPLTELESYCRLAQIRKGMRMSLVQVIRALDNEYLAAQKPSAS